MSFTIWSTSAVRECERFEYWREVVCQSILDVSTESPPDGHFQASISAQRFGDLRFASFKSNRHNIVRSPRHVRNATEATYLVSLQQSGTSYIRQGDACFELRVNEIAIMDSRRPFQIGFSGAVNRIVAVVPQMVLETRAPWLKRSPAHRLTADAPFAALARQHLIQLASPGLQLGDIEANLLTDSLCNLISLSTRGEERAERRSEIQLQAILAFCLRNLFDPELSPKKAAQALGISVRTLHLRFEGTDQTFSSWLQDRRLDACREALRDPRQSAYTISEIAYRAGFNDLSHFCRVFRSRFGVSARQWRASVREPHS